MTAASLRRETVLLPRHEDGLGVGALMALLVHILLVLGLALGVSWRVSEPAGMTAELWSSVPQAAAPPAVEPPPVEPVKPPPQPVAEPPPPRSRPVERDADIALEKAKRDAEKARQQEEEREKAEREKALKDKAEKDKAEKDKLAKAKAEADAEKRRKQEEDARLAKLRDENLKRMMGQVGGTGTPTATGTAARSTGPSASYAGKVRAAIYPKITYIHAPEGNPAAEVLVRASPDGTILSRQITKGSGEKEWDDAVLDAIDKTARLPKDDDGSVPSAIIITFRPKG